MEGHKETGAGQPAASIGDTPATASTALITAEQAVRMDCLQLAVQRDREGDDTNATIDRARAFGAAPVSGSCPKNEPIQRYLILPIAGPHRTSNERDGSWRP